MHQQRALLSESFPAGVADEGPLLAVQGAVHLQVSSLREALAAHFTAECPSARVDELVAAQVGRHAEALAAVVAAEGLLAGVDTAMHRQAAPAGEANPTLLAGVRALTCVCPQMSSEAALLAEGCAADTAAERLQASVNGQLVHMDAAAGCESFLACGTYEWFVCQVNPAVCRQVAAPGELLPAVVTFELFCFLTLQSVLSEAASRGQCLATGRACDWQAECLVLPEVAAGAEHLSAVGTPVRAFSVVHGLLVHSDTALS